MSEKIETMDDLRRKIKLLQERNSALVETNNDMVGRVRAAKQKVRDVQATLRTLANGLDV